MHRYVIMGVQGGGKGTQAKLLARDFDLIHLSPGDIFRDHIKHETALGQKIKQTVDSGQLVPDETVEEIMQQRLDELGPAAGFILDGFPRSRHQAAFLLEHYEIDAVIHIDVADDVVVERLVARRLCSQCGHDYNLISNPPQTEGICDDCGGELITRADDNEQAIRDRIADYHTETKPVLELFREKSRVVTIDGSQPPDEGQAEIRRELGL